MDRDERIKQIAAEYMSDCSRYQMHIPGTKPEIRAMIADLIDAVEAGETDAEKVCEKAKHHKFDGGQSEEQKRRFAAKGVDFAAMIADHKWKLARRCVEHFHPPTKPERVVDTSKDALGRPR